MFNRKPDEFPVLVVYKSPTGKPPEFVARAHYTNQKTGKVRTDFESYAFEKYEDMAAILKDAGLIRVNRMEGDDPSIWETWI